MTIRKLLDAMIGGVLGLAFFAPSACAGAYMFLTGTGSVGSRFLAALVAAIVVPVAAFIGFSLCLVLAAFVLQERNFGNLFERLPAANALAGLFLFTFLWIWWQHDKHTVVRNIAECVESASRSKSEVVNGSTVITCYEALGSEDNSPDP